MQRLGTIAPGTSFEGIHRAILDLTLEALEAQGAAVVIERTGSVEVLALAGDVPERLGALAADLPGEGEVDAVDLQAGASVARAGFAVEGRPGALICLGGPRLDADDRALFALIAHQAGLVATRQARQRQLLAERVLAERQTRLWRTLAELGQAVMRGPDRLSFMRQVCEIAVAHGDFRFAWIGERDPQGEVRPIAWSGRGSDELFGLGITLDAGDAHGRGPAARALREGVLCTADDLASDPELEVWRAAALRHDLRSVAAVPVRVRGALRLVLVIYGRDSGEFGGAELASVLEQIGEALSFGLEVMDRRRLADLSERQVRLQREIVEQSSESLVVLAFAGGGDARFVYVNPAFEAMTGRPASELVGGPLSGLLGPGSDREALRAMREAMLAGETWTGEIVQYRKDGKPLLTEWRAVPIRGGDEGSAQALVSQRDVTEHRRMEEHIAYLAHHDALTGLPNRVLLEERVGHALHLARRRRGRFAVALIDLDEFKQVNDSFGHAYGDSLLQMLAQRLLEGVRAEDTIARTGGDEFVLLVEDFAGPEQLAQLLRRLMAAVEQPCTVQGRAFSLRCSIGVAVYPEDGGDADILLRRADLAMYAAKKDGEQPFRFYRADMDEVLSLRGDLRGAVRQAFARGELELHYQPICNLDSHRIVALEALLRWRDPEQGLRLPGEFLPAIAGTSLADDVGRFVVETASAQAAALHRQGIALAMTVNVSARHFLHEDFPGELRDALGRHPELGPGALTVEITESAAVHDVELARRQVARCHEIGVEVALDDFGTGSSSITLLQELPCDTVKIDQRFIATMLDMPESPAIIHGVLLMGHAMERRVVAEGVETVTQARALMRLGCRLAQGFAIAPPMLPRALPGFLSEFSSRPNFLEGHDQREAGESFERLAAAFHHLRWAALVAATTADPLRRPYGRGKRVAGTCCGLGYWIEVYGREHFGCDGAFAELERLHEENHRLVRAAAEARSAGDQDAAERLGARIWRLKDDLVLAIGGLRGDPGKG